MQMNSYKYYQVDYKMSGNKDKKNPEEVNKDTNLFFII